MTQSRFSFSILSNHYQHFSLGAQKHEFLRARETEYCTTKKQDMRRERVRENERHQKRRISEERKNRNQTAINRNTHTSDRSANYSYNHFASIRLTFIFFFINLDKISDCSLFEFIFIFNSTKFIFITNNSIRTVRRKT